MIYTRRDPHNPAEMVKKYFDVHSKSKVLDCANQTLTSLKNEIIIIPDEKSKAINTVQRKKPVRKSPSKSKGATKRSRPVYFVSQRGKVTLEEDKADPALLILVLKPQYFFISRTIVAHEFSISKLLRALQSFSNIFESESEKVVFSDQVREHFRKNIQALRKRLSHFSLAAKALVRRRTNSIQGIGKGVEGYIPFRTWARGSLNSQLVNSLVFVDKLSQIKVC